MALEPRRSLIESTQLSGPPEPFNKDPMLCKLFRLMENNRNVLLIGGTGVGKTGMILQTAAWLNLKMKYMNAATLDPYADLAGMPVVDVRRRLIEFIHDNDLDNYDVFFVDEINRPSHPKVLNGLLELVQFKSVQGRPFGRLKMVFAAMNPPNQNHQVDDVDIVLLDRFHHFITVPKTYSLPYFTNKFGKILGGALVEWVLALSQDKQNSISPRRLDYIGEAYKMYGDDLDLLTSTVIDGAIDASTFRVLKTKIDSATNNLAPTSSAAILGRHIKQQKDINSSLAGANSGRTSGEGDGALLGAMYVGGFARG